MLYSGAASFAACMCVDGDALTKNCMRCNKKKKKLKFKMPINCVFA